MKKQFTKDWWKLCLNDTDKLNYWLICLYNTEFDAFERFKKFAETYCKNDKESFDYFMNIANEEANHAKLVENVLINRNIQPEKFEEERSKYFSTVNSCINSKETAAAIGNYAETLSLYRMRVIISIKETPQDIKEMFQIIEPEEARHATILRKIATKYGMKQVLDCHNKGLEKLGLKILS